MKIAEDKGYDVSKFKRTVHLETGDAGAAPGAAGEPAKANELKNSDGGFWFLRGLFWSPSKG